MKFLIFSSIFAIIKAVEFSVTIEPLQGGQPGCDDIKAYKDTFTIEYMKESCDNDDNIVCLMPKYEGQCF